MKTLLLAAISLVFVGSAAAGPNDFDANASIAVASEAGDAVATVAQKHISEAAAAAAKDAADDREFARLMAEAPDQGDFGDSDIVDKTGAEIRVSGFGFNDE